MALSMYTIKGIGKYSTISGYVYSPNPDDALKAYLLTQKMKPKKIVKLTPRTTKNLLNKLELDDSKKNLLVHFTVRYEMDYKNLTSYYIEI